MHSPLPGQATGLALPMQGLGHLGARDHGRAKHKQQLLQQKLALLLLNDVSLSEACTASKQATVSLMPRVRLAK